MTSCKRRRFKARPLHRRKEPHAMHYLSQKVTFWIAVFSLMAFVTGNMLGQHGWRVFWKSVLGQQDDSLIVYTGTVPPLARVPDYRHWTMPKNQVVTFADVPQNLLVPLPAYTAASGGEDHAFYSIGYMGSYATGEEGTGSHPGVDIRVPVGAPVQAVMNGIVTAVREDGGGFGKYVVLRHPNVPDPLHPGATTTLFSVYAHLSEQLVEEGAIVQKGQTIAKSGQSGLVSGPHLHFQIDRATFPDGTLVPYHPYWPFTGADERAAGMSFSEAVDGGLNRQKGLGATANPMLYVQAQYAPVMVAAAPRKTPEQLREERKEQRIARLKTEGVTVATVSTSLVAANDTTNIPPPAQTQSSSSSAAPRPEQPGSDRGYVSIEVKNASSFTGRKWETATIILKDADGETATDATLKTDLYLRTAYGRAEFRPATLSAVDFKNGRATVQVLPLTHTTLVIEVQPGGVLGLPMRYRE